MVFVKFSLNVAELTSFPLYLFLFSWLWAIFLSFLLRCPLKKCNAMPAENKESPAPLLCRRPKGLLLTFSGLGSVLKVSKVITKMKKNQQERATITPKSSKIQSNVWKNAWLPPIFF